MKNPFRRRRPAAVPADAAEQAAADALRARLAFGREAAPRTPLAPDVQERIDAALEPYKTSFKGGAFFGVPITNFDREELMQIIAWVADNARDHRRDS